MQNFNYDTQVILQDANYVSVAIYTHACVYSPEIASCLARSEPLVLRGRMNYIALPRSLLFYLSKKKKKKKTTVSLFQVYCLVDTELGGSQGIIFQ